MIHGMSNLGMGKVNTMETMICQEAEVLIDKLAIEAKEGPINMCAR